jgi:hypothetical protein
MVLSKRKNVILSLLKLYPTSLELEMVLDRNAEA